MSEPIPFNKTESIHFEQIGSQIKVTLKVGPFPFVRIVDIGAVFRVAAQSHSAAEAADRALRLQQGVKP